VTGPGTAVCLLLAEEVWGSPLHAMRSLAHQGVPTYVAVAGSGAAILGRSRSCAGAIDLDATDAATFVATAARWVASEVPGGGPVVVIPLSDRLVAFLDAHRDELPGRLRPAIPTPAVCDELLDKERSLAAAARAGLQVPRHVTVRDHEDLATVTSLQRPIVVRPTSWDTVGEEHFKLTVHHDDRSLDRELRARLRGGSNLLVQEYLDVPESAVEFAIVWRSQDGSRTAICTGRKRRQSAAEGGVMAWGETTDASDVADAARRFLDRTGFTGFGGIELIRQADDLWFVEFNPRLEAIHFLAARAGVDTVPMGFWDLVGRSRPPPTTPRRRAAAWVGSAWLARLRSDGPGRRDVLLDRWRFARAPGRVRAIWSWRDPGPGLAVVARLLRRAARRTVVRDVRRTAGTA
jgi:predicted ATP-grasp superfamily ATP-dependent carboligase